jgi:hypothetical protein
MGWELLIKNLGLLSVQYSRTCPYCMADVLKCKRTSKNCSKPFLTFEK